MRRWIVDAEIAIAVFAIAWVLGACSTVKTENRVMVDPIEVKPITVNVNANVNMVIELKQEARRVVDMITGEAESQSFLRWLVGAAPARAAETENAYQAAVRRAQDRWPEIVRWADRGCLGFDNRALVAVRPCDASETEARAIAALAAAENIDREEIYGGRAREKDLDAEGMVVFRVQLAQEWRERARPGHWIQVPADRREFLNFKNTPLGERLMTAHDGALTPGNWYRVP